ncbi:MAG: alpha/beta fold hydrolase [Chloroflexi bacterium]|nr:alpha/beta fold hydrolase [Chloroflexota bacterium]
MDPRIQYAKTEDGVNIAYWTMGEGEPLVHVPLPFSHIQLELQIPEMRRWYEGLAREHTLVRYDHRGFGLSDRTTVDLSLPTQVGDLEALIEKLGFETFALFGPVVMGPIAIEYAARHPEKVSHLLLWCSWASYSDYLRSPRNRALVALRDQDWETYTEAVAHTMLGWAEGEPSSRYAALMRESVSAEAVRDGLERKGDKLDVTARLERVKSPTLVLHRREVAIVDVEVARGLASRIPDAQLALLEGDSAAPFLGDTQAVLDAIADFLGQGEETSAAEQRPEPPTQTPPAPAVRRAGPELMEQELGFCTTSDGVSIAYATVGDGPPLVYAAGLPGDLSAEWEVRHSRELIEDLAQGFTLIRYDMRGCGLSDREPGELSFDNWILDLEAVVDHLHLEGFPLLSLGFLAGPICIAYAAAHPERVSHLIISEGYTRGADLGTPEQAKTMVDFTSLYGFAVTAGRTDLSADELQSFQDVTKIQSQAASLKVQAQVARTIVEVDVSSSVENISMPTLIMHSHNDLVPFRLGRNLAAAIPQAKFVPFDEPVSAPWIKQERITTAIRRFLGVEVEPKAEPTSAPAAGRGEAAAVGMTRVSEPAGRTFASGRYVVKRLLGEGAQKTSYLVDDTVLGRECALSVLNAALLDPSDVDRIKREAQTMAQLGVQPNIVTVHDYGEEDGAPYIVCEYVPGGELRDELAAAAGPLALERALAVAMDICRALSFAHRRDIVHRDLKPENVWLTEERNAKLGDFGIALSLGRTRLTMPGGLTGTAAYMAPEQVSGGDVDARSDLYAFGVLLYELVAGRPPFVGDDPNAIIYQHVNSKPESPAEHNASVPPGLERLIMKLLAKPKAERPASAEEVLAELEQTAADQPDGPPGATAAVRGTGREVAAGDSRLIEQEIRFCTSADGTRIAYRTYGEPAARALVLVVPFENAQEFWWKPAGVRTLHKGLASGRRLVTFDRRGVGSSQRDVDDLTISAQVADLAAVIDQLGLETLDLTGWSNGGALAAAYAAEHPDRVGRLILWHPLIRTSGPPLKGMQDLAKSIRTNWSLGRRSWASISYPNGPTDQQRWFSNTLRDSLAPEVAARHFEVIAEFDGNATLRSVQAPTLVLVHSERHDLEVASIQAVASLIQDARLVTLEGDWGTLVVDPSQMLAAIRNFFDETDAGAEASR